MSTTLPNFRNDAEILSWATQNPAEAQAWATQNAGGMYQYLAFVYLQMHELHPPRLNDKVNSRHLAYVQALTEEQCRPIIQTGNKTWVVVDAEGAPLHFVSAHKASMALRGYRAWAAKKGITTEPANVLHLSRWTETTGLTKATSGHTRPILVMKCPPNVGLPPHGKLVE